MRIISGRFRGKQIHPPAHIPVRPTTDFAKESLFNILNNQVDIESLNVLDLFSGTGSIAFEFISRGSRHVTAVDLSHKCVEFIRRTAESMNAPNLKAIKANVFRYLQMPVAAYDLVFADPPYDLERIEEIPGLVLTGPLLKEGGLFILEHSRDHDFSEHEMFYDHRDYGSVNFTFFRKNQLKNEEQ